MKLIPVRSSLLVGIGYKTLDREMVAQFDADTYYLYHNVPPEVVTEVLFADSVGSAFTTLIKKHALSEGPGLANTMTYERITKEQAFA